MELELINRLHPDIVDMKSSNKASAIMTIESEKCLYFSKEAVKTFNIVNEKFIHFGRAEGIWYFVINDLNTGFKIQSLKGSGARVHNTALIRLFLKTTKQTVNSTFYLQKSDNRHNGCPIIEIMSKKSLQQLKSKTGG